MGVLGWVWAGGEWVEEELLGLVWAGVESREGARRGQVPGLVAGARARPRAEAGASARQLERELEDLVSYDEGMLAAARSLGVSVSRPA